MMKRAAQALLLVAVMGSLACSTMGDEESGEPLVWNDPVTGLTWQSYIYDVTDLDYDDTPITFCDDLEYANFADWRLPDAGEVDSLEDRARGGWRLPGVPDDVNLAYQIDGGADYQWASSFVCVRGTAKIPL